MQINNPLFFTDRKQWRQWLEQNFQKEKEGWLVFPKKSSGKPRIAYNDAVEEALCFGWIDSTIKSLDKEHSAQRFTPRKNKSNYSQSNRERLIWLLKENFVHPSIEEHVRQVAEEEFIFPNDIMEEIAKDKLALKNFNSFGAGYKRIRIAYIDVSRDQPEVFQKRLDSFIKNTRENKLIKGYGGIEKYY